MTAEELRALPVYYYGAVELFTIDGRGMVGQEIAGELHERHGLHASAGRYSSLVAVVCWKAKS